MTDPLKTASLLIQTSTAASVTTFGLLFGANVLEVVRPPLVHTPPADHPIYALIGKVAATWSQLEHTLDLIIWHLAGIPPTRGACITAQILGATNRSKTIVSLLKERQTPAFDKLAENAETLMRRTFDPQEDRNRIIHDAWYMYEDQASQFRAMPAKDQRFGVCSVDVSKIEHTVQIAENRASWR